MLAQKVKKPTHDLRSVSVGMSQQSMISDFLRLHLTRCGRKKSRGAGAQVCHQLCSEKARVTRMIPDCHTTVTGTKGGVLALGCADGRTPHQAHQAQKENPGARSARVEMAGAFPGVAGGGGRAGAGRAARGARAAAAGCRAVSEPLP